MIWFGLILCISISVMMQTRECGSIDWRQLIVACMLFVAIKAVLFGL